MIDLIFEGSEKPEINKIKPIRNVRESSKPDGGFWTSPMTERGISAWRAWSDHAKFHKTNRWHVVLKPKCRILYVDQDLANLKPYIIKNQNGPFDEVIDFEKISKDYDMIYASSDVVRKHNNDIFGGFEVATGLFVNSKAPNGEPLLAFLTDKEFELFKIRQERKGEKISVEKDLPPLECDMKSDPILRRWAQAMEGEYGEEEQMKAMLALLTGISR